MSPIETRAQEWMNGGDRGASSKTIWAVMMGETPSRPSHPLDAGDFGRCYRLLRLIPEWRPRLQELAHVSPYWAALVGRWSDLEALAAAGDLGRLDAAMTATLDPVERDDRNFVRLAPGISIRFGGGK